MSNEDKKCAPSKTYSNGSCFTLNDLKNMANSFNNFVDKNQLDGEKITINNDKRHLVLSLTDRLSDRCKDQLCWLKQKFVKELKNEDLFNNTFRPIGPEGQFEDVGAAPSLRDRITILHKDCLFTIAAISANITHHLGKLFLI